MHNFITMEEVPVPVFTCDVFYFCGYIPEENEYVVPEHDAHVYIHRQPDIYHIFYI